MLNFPNGHSYKLIYLDTNVINAISKNTQLFSKNFFETYINENYAFALSVFNLYELSKAQGESKHKIIEFFDIIPLAVIETYPRLAHIESFYNEFSNDMIMFAMGPKMLGFNLQIGILFEQMDRDMGFTEAVQKMQNNFMKEIHLWQRNQKPEAWMKKFSENLLISMNESFQLTDNSFEINVLGKYKSVELFAFIKNQFIYSSQKEINQNSIIDTYNVAIAPYVEVYITENTVGSWLEMAKEKFTYLSKLQIIRMSVFFNPA